MSNEHVQAQAYTALREEVAKLNVHLDAALTERDAAKMALDESSAAMHKISKERDDWERLYMDMCDRVKRYESSLKALATNMPSIAGAVAALLRP